MKHSNRSSFVHETPSAMQVREQYLNLIEQDKRQRLLALDPDKSFIVQAPAGSGKTELLIQRFLTLLHQVKKPEEILAITFTKKAANEMRLRIIKALKQALSGPEPRSDHAKMTWLLAKKVLQRDQQYQWHLINNPNQLRIQTIDSLCSYLTKQLPLLSHFGSAPDISNNTNALYREAVQEVFMHVEENNEWSQALAKILLHLDNDLNKLQDLLIHLLAKRDQWLPYIHLDTQDAHIKQQLEHYLALIISDSLNTVQGLFPKELSQTLLFIARFAADNLHAANKESELLACRNLTEWPGIGPEDKRAWVGIAKLLLTKSFSWRKRVDEDIGFPPIKNLKNPVVLLQHQEYRQQLTQLIIQLSEREDLRSALSDLFFLPEPYYQAHQWDILQALLKILKVATAELRLVFQKQGQIDFIENAQAALIALGSSEHHTDLALALDYHIQHILVDEFQDTSFTQYQLLEKLTTGWLQDDGHTLFVVGDPMQSIYRFREAEVGLFIRMRKKGINQIKLIPLTLAMNFRSHPAIVEWNNAHFQAIFPAFNNMATGAVSYSPSVSENTRFANLVSTVTIRGFVNAKDDKETKEIIELIIKTKKDNPDESIAILVRSRSHLTSLVPLLKKAKLSYHAIDIDPLSSRQHIQDLLSLTCALIHPADRIAWLAILRAPWCGLTLADLLIIAGAHPYATIWEQLEQKTILTQLSIDGQERVNKLICLLKNKIAKRECEGLRAWVESTWLLLGGPACLYDVNDLADAHAFFKLLDEFANHTQLMPLDKLKERINQLYASTQHKEASLYIMTIHTAKGLEFDTVILPQLDRKLPYDDKSLLQWLERPLSRKERSEANPRGAALEQTALLLAPIHATGDEKDTLYEYINREQRIKSAYETDRLLYVATTRAKKKLYLFFNLHQNEKNEFKIESGSFLEKLWPFLEKNKRDILIEDNDDSYKQNTEQKHSRFHRRLRSTWQNPIQELNTAFITPHLKSSGFLLPNPKAKLIGTVTHSVFQHITKWGYSWWTSVSRQEQFQFLQHQFKQLGLSQEEIQDASQSVFNAIQCALNDARGQWILSPHEEAQSELAITAILNGKAENLVIDRTFVDNGIRWIIDYKTTMPSYQNKKDFLAQEQEKYREQMLKYYHAMQLLDTRPIRLGLYFPSVPAWCEW